MQVTSGKIRAEIVHQNLVRVQSGKPGVFLPRLSYPVSRWWQFGRPFQACSTWPWALCCPAVGAGLPCDFGFPCWFGLHFKHPVLLCAGAQDTQGQFLRKARPFAGRGAVNRRRRPPLHGFARLPVVPRCRRRVCPCGLLRLGGQARLRPSRGLGLNVDVLVQIQRPPVWRAAFQLSGLFFLDFFGLLFVGAHGAALTHADADHHGSHGQIQPGSHVRTQRNGKRPSGRIAGTICAAAMVRSPIKTCFSPH